MIVLKSLRLLIVANKLDQQNNYKQLLHQDNSVDYVLSEVASGSEGLSVCKKVKFDCILFDQEVTDLDCLDFLSALSNNSSDTLPPTVILLGTYDILYAVNLMKNGAQDCLVKCELQAKVLQQSVNRAVDTAELMRSAKTKQEELKRLAVTDDLTGLYSRRYLLEHLQQEQHRASRYKVPFCILMIDLDHFKQINDVHGHLAGDQVLKSFSTLLHKCTRQSDIVCRYGGEEFLVVLTNTLLNAAQVVAERIRMSAKTKTHTSSKGDKFRVTCSIGLTEYEQGIYDVNALINIADKALYRAKYLGRNRVCTWSNETSHSINISNVG